MWTWTFGASMLIGDLLFECASRERARAPRSSAARRLRRADERAHELAVDLGRDGVGVDALVGEELARVFHAVDARRLDTDRLETGRGELVAILPLLEGAGHAADPVLDVPPDLLRHFAADHHVRDREPAARLEHAEGLRQHAVLV